MRTTTIGILVLRTGYCCMHVRHIKYYMKSYYDGGPLIIISVRESTFLEIYIFKRCPEGRICGKFLKKKSKMYFIEGRF